MPITVAVGTLILNIFPAISYLLLLGALGWLGFSFYKKTSKKLPAIAAVAALVLVATMPSGGNAERYVVAGGGNKFGISGKARRPDFSSEAKIKAYFEAYLERNYPNALSREVSVSAEASTFYVPNGDDPVKGFKITFAPNGDPIKGFNVSTVALEADASGRPKGGWQRFDFFVTPDGRIFTWSDYPYSKLLN